MAEASSSLSVMTSNVNELSSSSKEIGRIDFLRGFNYVPFTRDSL